VPSPPSPRAPRILATVALLTVAVTFLLAQIDFARRHRIGIAPESYWKPQLLQIWLPGLGLALLLGALALCA
jgi:hypothetical protein